MEETQPATRELPFYLASRKHRFGGSMVGLGIEFTIAMVCATAIVLMTPSLRNGTKGNVSLPQLAILLFLVMLWSIFTWASGRTPAHLILRMRVYSTDTGKPASWRHMALRCFLIPAAFTLIPEIITQTGKHVFHHHALVILGDILFFGIEIVDGLWIFRGSENQRLVDVFAHTVVVNECEPNPYANSENADREGERSSEGHEEPLV